MHGQQGQQGRSLMGLQLGEGGLVWGRGTCSEGAWVGQYADPGCRSRRAAQAILAVHQGQARR